MGPEKTSGAGVEGGVEPDIKFFEDGLPPPIAHSQPNSAAARIRQTARPTSSRADPRSANAIECVRALSITRDDAGGSTVQNAHRCTGTHASRVHFCLFTWTTDGETGRASPACPVESNDADKSIDNVDYDGSSTDGGPDTPTQPRHDMLYMPDFPTRSTRSRFTRDGRVRGAMLVLEDDAHSLACFPPAYQAAVGQISHSPPAYLPASYTTPAALIGKWPNESSAISKERSSDVSS